MLNINYPYSIKVVQNKKELNFKYSKEEHNDIINFEVISSDGELNPFKVHKFTFNKKNKTTSNTIIENLVELSLRDKVIQEILANEKLM